MAGRAPSRMKVVALVPARGGSRRIPRKNLEKVGGLTLLERAIQAAHDCRRVEAVVVSTEDPEIRRVAYASGANVRVRPMSLARDDSTTDSVVADFITWAKLDADDAVVLLEPSAPFRTASDIDALLDLMLPQVPAARIVHVDPLDCHGEVYRDEGLAAVIRVGHFNGCLFPEGTVLLHRGDDRAMNIDTFDDLVRAQERAAPTIFA